MKKAMNTTESQTTARRAACPDCTESQLADVSMTGSATQTRMVRRFSSSSNNPVRASKSTVITREQAKAVAAKMLAQRPRAGWMARSGMSRGAVSAGGVVSSVLDPRRLNFFDRLQHIGAAGCHVHGNVGHVGVIGGAVPVLLAVAKYHDVAWLHNALAVRLAGDHALALDDDQGLLEGVCVPLRTRARHELDEHQAGLLAHGVIHESGAMDFAGEDRLPCSRCIGGFASVCYVHCIPPYVAWPFLTSGE